MNYYRRAAKCAIDSFHKLNKYSRKTSQYGGLTLNQGAYHQVRQFLPHGVCGEVKKTASEYSLRSLIAAFRPSFRVRNGKLIRNYNVLENRFYPSVPFTPRKPPRYYACGIVSVYVLFGSLIMAIMYYSKKETVPYTKRVRFVSLTPKMEKRVGDFVFKQMVVKRNKDRILPDEHPDSIKVRKITKAVVQALQNGIKQEYVWGNMKNCDSERKYIEELKWEVIVVDDPDTVNACCAPGGKIAVYSGLLKKFGNDAEIATVIGHEVTHAIARHFAEFTVKAVGIIILSCICYEFLPEFIVDTFSDYFLDLPMSRKHELEADRIGLLLMASAGYDPQVAPLVYQKLSDDDFPIVHFLSTHPSGKQRAQLLSEAKIMEEARTLYLKEGGHQVRENVRMPQFLQFSCKPLKC